MDTSYTLVILWFVFFCLTFGCIIGGDVPKKWVTPTKTQAFKAWIIAVFWPVALIWIIIDWSFDAIKDLSNQGD